MALFAQADTRVPDKGKQAISDPSYLFDSDSVLQFKLMGRCNDLFNDRGDDMKYHSMLLQYRREDNSMVSIPLRMQTRGNFRRRKENCTLPPLMMNFPKLKAANTIFERQNKLKLVTPCRGDEYVIREWLVYQLYNLVTEKSFKARLAQVEFEDSLKKRKTEMHYCIVLEDEARLAQRNKAFVWNRTKVAMKDTDRELFLRMSVFQFMIGNTDWSVPFLQNIKLVTKDSTKAPYAVPYDFDHSGMVSAPYAHPAEELEMTSILERRYRGYCESGKDAFTEVVKFFNALRDEFYKVYTGCKLLNAKYVKFATRYLDDFYRVINNPRALENEFRHPCRGETRIEIQGLKKR